jgi:hypothetical protein
MLIVNLAETETEPVQGLILDLVTDPALVS